MKQLEDKMSALQTRYITKALLTLTPLEERVIREKYFNDKDIRTLEKELFSHFKTRRVDRVRIILNTAERKLSNIFN